MKRELRRRLEKLKSKLTSGEDLVQAIGLMNDEQRELVVRSILYWDEKVVKLSRTEERGSIAWGLHDATDRAVAETMAKHPRAPEVQCRKGCSHCCKVHVGVSLGEAELLLHHARENSIPMNVERLAAQAGRTLADWKDIPDEHKACIFLGDDGACQVYEHRPVACRKLLVVTDPDNCDIVKNYGAQVGRLGTMEAEVIFSVLLSRQKNGSMADMVLEALK